MPQSAYYDSCVFLNALNTTHPEHASCAEITTPASIKWVVCVCTELISAETSAGELIAAFEINCALAGVIVSRANLNAARKLAAKHKNEKLKLKKLQLKDRDFTHLMCAVHSGSESLISVDPDFWAAANKRNRSAKRLLDGTKKYIERNFAVKILMPSELIAA